MNRTIPVSTEVFAAIWARRQEGEESEDAILHRLLGLTTPKPAQPASPIPATSGGAVGFHDARNGVDFPRGFEIFRSYKRKDYKAVAQDGHWLRPDTGDLYPSLNQLNASIAAGNENVWNGNWKYRDQDGTVRSISALRR